jgi:hypothetical protein
MRDHTLTFGDETLSTQTASYPYEQASIAVRATSGSTMKSPSTRDRYSPFATLAPALSCERRSGLAMTTLFAILCAISSVPSVE